MDDQSCSDLSNAADLVEYVHPVWSPASASLVASETNAHPLDTQSGAQKAIHHGVDKQRRTIIGALHSSTDALLQRRASKMGMCCVAPMIFADQTSLPVCVAGYCRDRLCPTCMRRRAFKVRCRLIGLVGQMNSPRFLTLTRKDTPDKLAKCMDDLTAAVKKLRRTDSWKRHVKGGVMVWQVTRNEQAGTWHLHVHMVIDGSFFPHATLHAEWTRILGGPGTTDLAPVHDRNKAARYIGKYLASDSDVASWSDGSIQDFAVGMHRRRLIATFGSSHKVNLDLCDEEQAPPAMPKASISYGQMMDAIAAGVPEAERAAPLLARLGIAFRQLFFAWAMPGECYADEIPTSMFEDLGRWIEGVHAQLMAVEEPEPLSAPPPDPKQLGMFDESRYT